MEFSLEKLEGEGEGEGGVRVRVVRVRVGEGGFERVIRVSGYH